MKKIRTLLLLTIVLLSPAIYAIPINSKEALKIADEFMLSTKKAFPQGYTRKATSLNQVYVVNYICQNQQIGYVVVAGDNGLPSPILAFSMQGNISLTNKTIKGLLEDYCEEIKEWQDGKAQYAKEDTIHYQQKNSFCPSLLKGIFWHQKAPYNLHMPLDADGKKSLVGCTPVSMGQIMKYYQYPDHGTGESTYMHTNKNGKTFSAEVNYDSLQINWDNIESKYTLKESDEASGSVSQLLYYCALSAEANFSSEATGAGIHNATRALFKHFKYHPSIRNLSKKDLSDNELKQLLYRELEAKRPVLCSGYQHSFVCDGFANDYFHFNWGWEGRMNGYFKLSALKAGTHNFRMLNQIVVNIRPHLIQKESHKAVKLSLPGTLHQHISEKEAQTLTSLAVVGKLNGEDFCLLRKMAGSTESIWEDGGELHTLDLSKAEIVADFENPYYIRNARKARQTQTMSGTRTPDKQPKMFKFETMDEKEWELLCQLKGEMDYKNQAWKYVKRGNDYYLQYYTNAHTITSNLFKDCTNLKKLILPEQTQAIKQSAFLNCSSLQQIEIPSQTTDIHPRAWQGCLSIKAVSAHPASPHFTDKDGVLYSKDSTVLVYYPAYKTDFTYHMPQSIEYLRSYAFDEALFLRTIHLSERIKKIPEYAFYICPSLQTVQLPESVSEINNGAFFRCKTLSKVYLPSNVKKMGLNVFNQCADLTDIYCKSATPPEVKEQTFNGLKENEPIKLWVPQGATEAYKQTPWNFFGNISEL